MSSFWTMLCIANEFWWLCEMLWRWLALDLSRQSKSTTSKTALTKTLVIYLMGWHYPDTRILITTIVTNNHYESYSIVECQKEWGFGDPWRPFLVQLYPQLRCCAQPSVMQNKRWRHWCKGFAMMFFLKCTPLQSIWTRWMVSLRSRASSAKKDFHVWTHAIATFCCMKALFNLQVGLLADKRRP